ncbi:unnamed protein product [Penicillium manginii]
MASNNFASISNLAPELLIRIFQLLDPASLISLSQTNVHLRWVIQPTKLDFCERLLFFESKKQGGETVPVYDSRTNKIQPECSNKAKWKSMLWACSDCLHMLPHTAFDDHHIFGLGYRKPIPDSPMVTNFTSWEPASTGRDLTADEAWRQRHSPGIENEIKAIKKRYRIAITYVKKHGPLGQPSFAISPADIDDHVEYLTAYMIRCSACSTWKKSHEFQPGEDWSPMYLLETSLHHTDMMAEEPGPQETTHHEFQQWAHTPKDPKMYDDLRCNNCFVQVYSRQELYKFYMPLLEYHIERQKLRLVDGVYVKVRGLTNWCPTKWIHEVTNITKGFDNIRYCRYSPEFKSMGILSCYKASIKFLNRTKNAGKKHNCRNWHGLEGQVDGLQKDYDHRLVQMEWIKGIIPRVKEPDIVEKMIEWALSDTTRLLYF